MKVCDSDRDPVRVKKKILQVVLFNCSAQHDFLEEFGDESVKDDETKDNASSGCISSTLCCNEERVEGKGMIPDSEASSVNDDSARASGDLEFNQYLVEANSLLKAAKECLLQQGDHETADNYLYKSVGLVLKVKIIRPMSLLAAGQLGNTYLLHQELKLRLSRDLRALIATNNPATIDEWNIDDNLMFRKDKLSSALVNVCNECEELLVTAGRNYKLALSSDGNDMKALYNWALALFFRAQLIADIGPISHCSCYDCFYKVYLAAIDKFDAMMAKSNTYAPDALFRWGTTLQQRSRLRPGNNKEKVKLLQQARRLYEDALNFDYDNIRIYAANRRAGEHIKDFATAFGLSTMTKFVSKIRTKSQRCLKLEKMPLKQVCYESSNKEKHPWRMKIMLKNCCARRGQDFGRAQRDRIFIQSEGVEAKKKKDRDIKMDSSGSRASGTKYRWIGFYTTRACRMGICGPRGARREIHGGIEEYIDQEASIEIQLQVHGLENPSTPLVSVLLNDKNYLIWKGAMLSALEAKLKDGFVTGTLPKPPVNSPRFARWKQANTLVCSWIKSSMSPDIANTFAFIYDARTLWNDIAEQYGTTNLPQLFEIKREIALVRQRDSSVAAYYGRLKQLWDQQVSTSMALPIENSALVAKTIDWKKPGMSITGYRGNVTTGGYQKRDKSKLFCTHCNRPGHIKEECFKLTGIPEWYHEYKNKLQQQQPTGMNNMTTGMNNVSNMVIVGETPLDTTSDNNGDLHMVISGAVQKELEKILNGKGIAGNAGLASMNYAHFDSFADLALMSHKHPVSAFTSVWLPDGSICLVA
ncbi:OLC1v1019444C1 [Oldenlandia corymbosa var. corymbosa]|uniref:OLC1v1019444C1 n=1 Tax=Oldenlandia corymbosa var. corymbosa TaxID=529605 RepID=A0AAV1EDY7_OLDCO|nr:OLC1v1019444C1 [Oldenlandia corymbosa var. corymbosa]